MSWKNTDPRLDINKRANIVIVRPSGVGNYHLEAGIGFVDTKNGWYIWTSFNNHEHVDADDDWDTSWRWTFAP